MSQNNKTPISEVGLNQDQIQLTNEPTSTNETTPTLDITANDEPTSANISMSSNSSDEFPPSVGDGQVAKKIDKQEDHFKLFNFNFKSFVSWIVNFFKDGFKGKLSHNKGTKFLSLILAILFWIFVMDHVDPEITRVIENVPVQLINTQELDQSSLKIMNQTDYFVDVEVTGRRNNVLGLNSKSISLWADMRSVRGGVNNVFINSSINSESVSIKSILPKEIVLTVDRVVSIPKPVQIVFSDTFQEDLYQSSMTITPLEIKVTGPESIVNSVSYLGGTISVNTLTADYTREVSLVPYSYDGEIVNGVKLDINYATLSLVLGKTVMAQVETKVEGEVAPGYKLVSVKVTPEVLSISGEISKMENLKSILAETVTLEGNETQSFIVEKEVQLPEGVTIVGSNQRVQIELIIEEVQSKEFTFNISEIPVVNLNEKFKTDLTENLGTVLVKVKDIESIITSLTKNDIHLDINFSNVNAAGNYMLKVNIAGEETFNEIIIDPIYVDINVIEANTETP